MFVDEDEARMEPGKWNKLSNDCEERNKRAEQHLVIFRVSSQSTRGRLCYNDVGRRRCLTESGLRSR